MNKLQKLAERATIGLFGITMAIIIGGQAFGGAWTWELRSPPPRLAAGHQAPPFIVPVVDEPGMAVSSDALRGHPVLLAFWRKECVECVDTLRASNMLQRELGAEGLVSLAVSTDDYVALLASRQWAQETAPDMLRVHDWQARLFDQLQSDELPRWVVLDRFGRIAAMDNTPEPDRSAVLRAVRS